MSDVERYKAAMRALLIANDAASRAQAEKTVRELLYSAGSASVDATGEVLWEPRMLTDEELAEQRTKPDGKAWVPSSSPAQPAARPYPTLAEKTIVERKGDDDTARDSHKAL